MKRTIIRIDEAKCNGCALCIPNCPEGALELVDGKAKLARESFCDGLGACLGHCPEGAIVIEEREAENYDEPAVTTTRSELSHWPLQLHLISPLAPQYRNRAVLLVADCVPFALADFHRRFLKGRALAIACPKLDHSQEIYRDKLTALVDAALIASLTVITMEVPCCSGLLHLARQAASAAARHVPVASVVVSVRGEVLHEARQLASLRQFLSTMGEELRLRALRPQGVSVLDVKGGL